MEESLITGVDRDTVANEAGTVASCQKCGGVARIWLRKRDWYCEPCFLTGSKHKFRATLGKSRTIRQDDSVLIGHSGKANSTMLLHLVKNSTDQAAGKKLTLRCKVLYIDDGSVRGRKVEERVRVIHAIAKQVKDLSMTGYVVSLGANGSLCPDIVRMDDESCTKTVRDEDALNTIFHALESDTARDDFLRRLRRRLLVSVARKLDCNKVFVADTSVDLATKMLTDISTGRGAQLSCDVAFSDSRSSGVLLLRPLRDFIKDEVLGYLSCYQLQPVFPPHNYVGPFFICLRSAAGCFVTHLDAVSPGTVSAIYRTSEKLAGKNCISAMSSKSEIDRVDNVADNVCALCEVTLDVYPDDDGQLSAAHARTLSKLMSLGSNDSSCSSTISFADFTTQQRAGKDQSCRTEKCHRHDPVAQTGTNTFESRTEVSKMLENYLCYGCKLIFHNFRGAPDVLPTFLNDAMRNKMRLMRMRDEITPFLL